MALKPDLFPWECKLITHFDQLLERQTSEDNNEANLGDIYAHEHKADDEQALVAIDEKHRDLVPIFSQQVIAKY